MLRGISRFIVRLIRVDRPPDCTALEAGYQAATRELWRADLAAAWDTIETEDWPASRAEADTVGISAAFDVLDA